MLKGEIEIMTAIALNRCTYKQITNRRAALQSPYIRSTIESLVRNGYLTKSKAKGYQLTKKGIRVFAKFLPETAELKKLAREKLVHEHSAKAKEAINIIETLGLEYVNKVEE